MDWLSEIEEVGVAYLYESDIKRMARVLRELGGVIIKYRQAEGKALCEIFMSDCSDDAKELCVAARESSREE